MSDGVQKIIDAVVSSALARCGREGVALEDFHRALLAEQAMRPTVSVAELFDLTFARLRAAKN